MLLLLLLLLLMVLLLFHIRIWQAILVLHLELPLLLLLWLLLLILMLNRYAMYTRLFVLIGQHIDGEGRGRRRCVRGRGERCVDHCGGRHGRGEHAIRRLRAHRAYARVVVPARLITGTVRHITIAFAVSRVVDRALMW